MPIRLLDRSPLENAGEGMAGIFPHMDGMGKVGTLSLIEVETEAAGRPALLLHGSEDDYWFDRDTGLLLRKLHVQMGGDHRACSRI